MKTYGKFPDTRIDAICDDLLRKRPRGGGDADGLEFHNEEVWCDRYNEYRNLLQSNKQYWGYTPEEVQRLGFEGITDVERYIGKRFFNGEDSYYLTPGKKSSKSRKVNRIWDRIQAISNLQRAGGMPGVYSISAGSAYYAPIVGYVIAESKSHASQLGTTLFGVFMTDATDTQLPATYRGLPEVSRLEKKAAALSSKFDKKLKELDEQYQRDRAACLENQRVASMAQMVALDLIEDLGDDDAA